jgi:hypothetical protein
MSLLRIARPGQPTVLIDLGPATGRSIHTRGAIRGGAIVEVSKVNSDAQEARLRRRREAAARLKASRR